MVEIYTQFVGRIAQEKKVKGLTNADLAQMTGSYSTRTIEAFMGGRRQTDNVAQALGAALNIKPPKPKKKRERRNTNEKYNAVDSDPCALPNG